MSLPRTPAAFALAFHLVASLCLSGCGGEGGGGGQFSQEFEKPSAAPPADGTPAPEVEALSPRERRHQP